MPTMVGSAVLEDDGEVRRENKGRVYESVFPVPVGEMAARSRDYKVVWKSRV